MKTAIGALILAALACTPAFSAEKPAVLKLDLSKELIAAGWTVSSTERSESLNPGVLPGERKELLRVREIVLENRTLTTTVPDKVRGRVAVHATIRLRLYPRTQMKRVLAAWDARYEAKAAEFQRYVKRFPGTAIAPPRHTDGGLFWQTSNYVVWLSEDSNGVEVGFRENAAVKAAIKRQLIGR